MVNSTNFVVVDPDENKEKLRIAKEKLSKLNGKLTNDTIKGIYYENINHLMIFCLRSVRPENAVKNYRSRR